MRNLWFILDKKRSEVEVNQRGINMRSFATKVNANFFNSLNHVIIHDAQCSTWKCVLCTFVLSGNSQFAIGQSLLYFSTIVLDLKMRYCLAVLSQFTSSSRLDFSRKLTTLIIGNLFSISITLVWISAEEWKLCNGRDKNSLSILI